MNEVDFIQLAPQIGKQLLGNPTKETTNEIRWGTHGSWCLNLETGLFYSFEEDQGGGVIWLIDHFGQDRDTLLNTNKNIVQTTIKKTKVHQSFTSNQMKQFAQDSVVFTKYSDDFVVMRFPDNYKIKQKYAPFTKEKDIWYAKRPDDLMPIYLSEGKGPVLINEGEKAAKGALELYDGPVCCWHGGVNSWKKSDWSVIAGQEVIIWPDNDEAGAKCAKELGQYLISKKCKVKIAEIPSYFNPKDDLFDAYDRKDFDKDSFKSYIDTATQEARRGTLVLRQISDIITNIKEPEWIIKDILEKESVVDIYGAPKSGKSFIAIDMALCSSLGIEWHKHECKQSPVIYLAGEGQRGLARRVQAWEHYYGHDLLKSQLFISDRGVRFLDEKDHTELKEHIYDVAEQFGDIGTIYVDTLARNFGGGNENSTEDMNRFIERVDDLKQTFKSCIALIHHTGHSSNGRARGSSVLPAAVDAEFSVKRKDPDEEMFVEFNQTLVKDGKAMTPKYFKFQEVDLVNYPGMTSGVLVEADKGEMYQQDDSKMDETMLVIAELQDKFAKEQETDPINIWVKQKEIIAAQADLKESTVKQRVKRLADAGKIHHEDKKGYQSKKYDQIKSVT
jgi:hypothetical protein